MFNALPGSPPLLEGLSADREKEPLSGWGGGSLIFSTGDSKFTC
jgi:hypothetical protein